MSWIRQLGAVIAKDVLVELRSPTRVSGLFFYGLALLLLVAFASNTTDIMRKQAGGILWIGMLLASTRSFDQSFGAEFEEGAMEGLVLWPVHPVALYYGKAISNSDLELFHTGGGRCGADAPAGRAVRRVHPGRYRGPGPEPAARVHRARGPWDAVGAHHHPGAWCQRAVAAPAVPDGGARGAGRIARHHPDHRGRSHGTGRRVVVGPRGHQPAPLEYFRGAVRESGGGRMKFAWEHVAALIGLVLLVVGQVMGLVYSPPEQEMGDVVRILYVHVPAAWVAMLAFLFAFIGAVAYLFTSRPQWDWMIEAGAEVGVVMGVLLMILGAIFARPTWGVFWTWDARLTSTAILVLTFFGVMVLRSLVAEPERRAMWSSVVTIFGAINVPITYFSVDWWRSMHQMRSTGEVIDDPLTVVLRINALAFLFLTVWFLARRWRLAKANALAEAPPPLPPLPEEAT
ncbi:MAG: cytochrome c biogenesis protein CcsA [Deltaproteobacteria bacterium]|nr:cytochrome c biogenesis protein CcsA [Deltaproteobacteria bacterium]